MDILTAVFVAPFLDMADSPAFFFEVVIGGLMTGVMYSLVALGFVLIFKASSVFNFAQGVFALFAAMTLVGLMTGTVPFALDKALPEMPAFVAIVLTGVVMVGLAFLVERVVLRPMVNQDHIIMFMSTIGIAFVLEGFGDLMWGSDVKLLDIGIPTGSFFFLALLCKENAVLLAVFIPAMRIFHAQSIKLRELFYSCILPVLFYGGMRYLALGGIVFADGAINPDFFAYHSVLFFDKVSLVLHSFGERFYWLLNPFDIPPKVFVDINSPKSFLWLGMLSVLTFFFISVTFFIKQKEKITQ